VGRSLSRVVTGIGKDDGERKLVTVLFADVSGSMDLAESQDPEEWRKIMQRFFAILAAAVERFEGTVDKFTGDGVMAVFGAPIAHEDHARRACFAALRMLAQTVLSLFSVALLAYVVLSWIAPGAYSPATRLLGALCEPLLRPVRRIIPPIAGLDLAPVFVLIGLQALQLVLR